MLQKLTDAFLFTFEWSFIIAAYGLGIYAALLICGFAVAILSTIWDLINGR